MFQTDSLRKRADSVGILHGDVEVNAHAHVSDLDLPVKMQMRYDQRHQDKRSKWRFEWSGRRGPTARSVLKQISKVAS